MKARDNNPQVRVDEEPEDERPLGTGEEVKPDSNGLALDPYADDTLFELARTRVPRWLWAIVIILMIIVVALALALVIRARG
jgi:type IV secretory pathway component VirB8